LANVGIGCGKNSQEFYKKISSLAQKNNTSISVIGIEGEDCSLSNLSICCEATSGSVNIVKPLELQRKMRSILDNPVVGTNVSLSIVLHKDVNINKKNFIDCTIGNVNFEHDITFDFQTESKTIEKEIPFQTQITYTKQNGSKYLRVITSKKPVSNDVNICESNGDFAVLGLFAIQQSSKFGLAKNYESSLLNLLVYKRLMKRVKRSDPQAEEYANYLQKSKELENELIKQYNKSKKEDDTTIKLFHENKLMNKALLLSGTRKNEIIQKRKNHTTDLTSLSKNLLQKKLEEERIKQKKIEEELEKEKESQICIICEDSKINCVIVPCGHQTICTNCATKITECPNCRGNISQIVKTYGR